MERALYYVDDQDPVAIAASLVVSHMETHTLKNVNLSSVVTCRAIRVLRPIYYLGSTFRKPSNVDKLGHLKLLSCVNTTHPLSAYPAR